MIHVPLSVALLIVVVSLGGCRDAPPPTPPPADADTALAVPDTSVPDASAPDALSAEAAAEVVRRYYAAIATRDYRRAYALWGNSGPPDGQTFDAFAAGFAETASVTAEVGPPSDPEGAAGSIFVTVPVIVHARTTSGGEQTFTGTYTVRRVNAVPGATPAQLRWHLDAADLRSSP